MVLTESKWVDLNHPIRDFEGDKDLFQESDKRNRKRTISPGT
jgi:hypothetical protein